MAGPPPTVCPLTPLVGAEVRGLDLSERLTEDTVKVLETALIDHLVLSFRDQGLSLEALSRFGQHFGPPQAHAASPDAGGLPGIIEIHTDANSRIHDGRAWHVDSSFEPEPPMGSILHLRETPACGGDTLFANTFAAFEALSPPMQAFLAGLTARHSAEENFREYYKNKGMEFDPEACPSAEHPVIRTHPVSGRKGLFVNEMFTTQIVGLEPAESATLLGFLFNHINRPRFHCRIRWEPGTVVFWDNRSVQHQAIWDYYPQTRSGYRLTISGDRPH